MLDIDGTFGEGGGQILRTSLALSLITQKPFRIRNIRGNRPRTGLRNQHLAAVRAALRVGHAEVSGDSVGSSAISFRPREIIAGHHHFEIGTAGSTSLVLQTVLPALLRAPSPSTLIIEGATHNPMAPSFDFLDRAFLPSLARMGANVRATLERPGFYPAGGGRIRVEIEPVEALRGIDILERGELRRVSAKATVAGLPRKIAERELSAIHKALGLDELETEAEELDPSLGPGNIVTIVAESENVTECFLSFGRRGIRAEAVGREAAEEAREYLDSKAPIGRHLADQLLLPLALAGQGSFRTLAPTSHTRTQAEVIRWFLDVEIGMREGAGGFDLDVKTS